MNVRNKQKVELSSVLEHIEQSSATLDQLQNQAEIKIYNTTLQLFEILRPLQMTNKNILS